MLHSISGKPERALELSKGLGPNEGLLHGDRRIDALMTPALIIDYARFQENLRAHGEILRASGIAGRPHTKSHKCSEIARRQVASGVGGICVVTVHEAEAMVRAGVSDVLITSPVVGSRKVDQLGALLRSGATISVVVDDQENMLALAACARASGNSIRFLVDLDIGMGRTGVSQTEDAVALAREIEATEGCVYGGVQAYSGRVQHIGAFAERKRTYDEQMRVLHHTAQELTRHGLKPETISGGGTGTLALDCENRIFTEHQAGSYIFMDVEYGEIELPQNPFQLSLFLRTMVVSNPVAGRSTVDAGIKSLATDGPLPLVYAGAPADTRYAFFGDEHGQLTLASEESLPLETLVDLVTPHCDPTVNLHDYFHVIEKDELIDIWPIDARGVL